MPSEAAILLVEALLAESALMDEFSEIPDQPWAPFSDEATDGLPWRDWVEDVGEDRATKVAERVYMSAASRSEDVKDEFLRGLKRAVSGNPKLKIIFGTKKLSGFVNKVVKRKKNPARVTDILRATIKYPTAFGPNELESLLGRLDRSFEIVEYDYKPRGEDTAFGYFGTHHLIVRVNGVCCELQLMSNRMEASKAIGHEIYSKLRGNEGINPEEEEELKRTSKSVYAFGNLRPAMPRDKAMKARELIAAMDYDD